MKFISFTQQVRKLKSESAEKAVINIEVQVLLALKAEYKKITGKNWIPESTAPPKEKEVKAITKVSIYVILAILH